jgi:hypothetical protein
MKPFLVAVKNVLLWSHDRGSWQYDILCLLIVATIFVVPSSFFGDRDRVPAQGSQAQANGGKEIASKAVWTKIEVKKSELRKFLQQENKITLMDNPQDALRMYLRGQLQREVIVAGHETFANAEGQLVYNVTFK